MKNIFNAAGFTSTEDAKEARKIAGAAARDLRDSLIRSLFAADTKLVDLRKAKKGGVKDAKAAREVVQTRLNAAVIAFRPFCK